MLLFLIFFRPSNPRLITSSSFSLIAVTSVLSAINVSLNVVTNVFVVPPVCPSNSMLSLVMSPLILNVVALANFDEDPCALPVTLPNNVP